MPRMTIDEEVARIVSKVTTYEQSHEPLFSRMDNDHAKYWLLEKFKPSVVEGVLEKDAYTTNRPRVLAETAHNAIAMSKVVIRVENDDSKDEQREVNDSYESWAIGVINNANNRRLASAEQPIIDETAWYALTRGHVVAARAMLMKNPDGSTYEDIVPIDPRHLVFERRGGSILWAAVVTRRSRDDIRDEYPNFKFNDDRDQDEEDEGNLQEKVIDYFFTENRPNVKNSGEHLNSVIIAGKYAKNKVRTNCVRFPIVIRKVGRNPGISNFTFQDDSMGGNVDISGIENVGDSIWGPMRHVNEARNRSMSYRTAIMSREVQGVFTVSSPGGDKDVEGRIDEPGRVHQLDNEAGESIDILKLQEMGRDALVYDQAVGADELGADLPQAAYGNVSVPISGAVARMLGQTISNRIDPFVKPVEALLQGCIENFAAQYETGKYQDVTVAGRTRQDQNFNRQISPEDIKDHGMLTVRFFPELPEDKMEKYLIAQQAVRRDPETKEALMSYRGARDNILEMQSGDLEEHRNYAAIANTASPMLAITHQLIAAHKEGREDTVALLLQEAERLNRQQMMEDLAQEFAFLDAVGANPVQGAAGGVAGAGAPAAGAGQQMVGPDGLPIVSDTGAIPGVDSRVYGQQGMPGVMPEPSPVAGFNTAPEAMGIEPNI